jgi:hypothetical protein
MLLDLPLHRGVLPVLMTNYVEGVNVGASVPPNLLSVSVVQAVKERHRFFVYVQCN